MKIALLFPGQGAQYAGFLHALPDHAAVHETLREASELLGYDALTLDSEMVLRSTVSTQIALLIAGAAFVRFCAANEIQWIAVAGMSVGAYAAAIAAGAVEFPTALVMVRRRAELMEAAFAAGMHGMAAIDGLRPGIIKQLLQGTDVVIANHNSATQHVLAGERTELELLLQRSLAAGAVTAKLLPIAVASHTAVLLSAAEELLDFAHQLPFSSARIPMYSNRTARPLTTANAIREELALNMAHPVRWYDTVTALGGLGVQLLMEAPPGHTLTRLAVDTLPDVSALAVGEMRWDVLLRAARRAS